MRLMRLSSMRAMMCDRFVRLGQQREGTQRGTEDCGSNQDVSLKKNSAGGDRVFSALRFSALRFSAAVMISLAFADTS